MILRKNIALQIACLLGYQSVPENPVIIETTTMLQHNCPG